MSWYDNLDFTSNVLCISFDSTMSFGAFSKLQSWTVSDSTGCKGCKCHSVYVKFQVKKRLL